MNHALIHTEALIQSLSYALLHSLWQGALVGVVLWITLKAFKGLGSNARYALSYSALFFVLAAFLWTFVSKWWALHAVHPLSNDTIPITLPTTAPAEHQQHGTTGVNTANITNIQWLFPWLTLFYFAGILMLTVRFIIGIIRVRSFQYQNTSLPDKTIVNKVQQLVETMGITKPVQILLTYKLETPVVFGTLKPVILLPFASAMQLTPDQLEAILIHELAHIRRNDYLLNMFQLVAETILFFHPFVWLISAIIRREREHCCDDTVLSMTASTLPYARALAMLETYRVYNGNLALAASGNQHHLFNRIKRITTMKKQNINYSQLFAATLLLMTLGISVAYFTPAFAQDKKDGKKPSSSNVVKKEKTVIKVIDDEGNVKTYTSKEDVPQDIKERLENEEAITQHKTYTISKSDDVEDFDALADKIEAGMEKIDVDKIVNEALAEVDWKQINEEIANASRSHKIDAESMASADEAMKEADEAMKEADKAMKEAAIAMKDIDWEAVRKEAKNGMKEARKAMKEIDWVEIRKTVNESMKEARLAAAYASADARRAHSEVRRGVANDRLSFDKMLDKMEAEGLIDRADGFKIKKRGDRLYINGEEQFDDILKRYKPYLKGDVITIKGNDDNLNVSITN